VLKSRKVPVMNAHFAGQLPDPLNRIEFRTVGRQEIKAQNSPMIPEPGLQGSRVMISGVIQNNHHFLSGKTMTNQMRQKNLKGFSIELFPLLSYQSSYASVPARELDLSPREEPT